VCLVEWTGRDEVGWAGANQFLLVFISEIRSVGRS
jgi:hypothetical protein